MSEKAWNRATHPLIPLMVGTVVSVQNQRGRNSTKWDKSGVVVECLPFNQYRVRIDGTGRITLRNRVALQRIIPFNSILDHGPQMEHSKASLKPKTGEVEVGSSPDLPPAPQESAFNIPDASQGTIVGVPVIPCAPQEITLDEDLNGPPGDPDTFAIVVRRSSRMRKINL